MLMSMNKIKNYSTKNKNKTIIAFNYGTKNLNESTKSLLLTDLINSDTHPFTQCSSGIIVRIPKRFSLKVYRFLSYICLTQQEI